MPAWPPASGGITRRSVLWLSRNAGNSARSRSSPTGHLFTAGGVTVEGDGVRELYVGSLAHVEAATFPETIDYLALGHLHVPQKVGGSATAALRRFPIPLGFGEARQQKMVLLAEFAGREATVRELPVPCFQKLERIRGSLPQILDRIAELRGEASTAWLEIEYTGTDLAPDLREQIDQALQDTGMECHRVRNAQVYARTLSAAVASETLNELDPSVVFARCLDQNHVASPEREELMAAYQEIVRSVQETDRRAD